jgi:hypothetical protein
MTHCSDLHPVTDYPDVGSGGGGSAGAGLASPRGQVLAELGEEGAVEAERRLHLGDDACLLLGGRAEPVEPGAAR